MQERIIQAIFGVWCESLQNIPEEKEAVDNLANRFQANTRDELFIETEIANVVSIAEKGGFVDGLIMGVGLASGRLFEGVPLKRTKNAPVGRQTNTGAVTRQ